MKIEIIKGSENPVTQFFSAPSNTTETDDHTIMYGLNENGYQVMCVDSEFARQLERERDEARAERDSLKIAAQREAEQHDRMVGELEKVYDERDEAREQNAKLRDIAERAINDFNGCKAQTLRSELNQLKDGMK